MNLQSLSRSAKRWLGARRHDRSETPQVELVPIMILAALTLIGLYFVITRFVGLVTPPDAKASPLKAVGLIVVATTAGLIYARVVAWLDRNEKEPWRLMVSVLLLGAIAGFGVVNGVNRLLKSDLESLLEKPPLNEAEYLVLFSAKPHQVLELKCSRPEEAVDVLCGMERFSMVLRRMNAFNGPPEKDWVIFVVSERISDELPESLRGELAQSDILCQTREEPHYYVSSRDFFDNRVWLDVRERIWKVVGPKRIGPLVEEAIKGLLVLLLFIGLRREFDGPLDGIVYGALVGLGFALTENAVYMIGNDTQEQFLRRIVLRGLSGHATYTAFTGWGLGIARANRNKNKTVAGLSPIVGFATAVFAHMVWNTLNKPFTEKVGSLASGLALNGPFVFMMVLCLLYSWRQEDEVVRNHLPVDLYDKSTYTAWADLESAQARYRAIQHAARTMGLQKARLVSALHRTLIEIAFCYWHADLDGVDPSTVPGLSALRHRVLDLRTRLKGEPALTVATDDPPIDPPRTAPGD